MFFNLTNQRPAPELGFWSPWSKDIGPAGAQVHGDEAHGTNGCSAGCTCRSVYLSFGSHPIFKSGSVSFFQFWGPDVCTYISFLFRSWFLPLANKRADWYNIYLILIKKNAAFFSFSSSKALCILPKKKQRKLGSIPSYFQDEQNVLTKLLNLYLSFQDEYNVLIKSLKKTR